LFGFCFSTEVIIYEKGGNKVPPCASLTIGLYQSIVKPFFFEALVIGTTFSVSTTFSTFVGSGVGSGVGSEG